MAKKKTAPTPEAEPIDTSSDITEETPTLDPNRFRRWECPSTRDGMKLLWRPDTSFERSVRFLAGFYATNNKEELACLEWLERQGQVVEVPYETYQPTRPDPAPVVPAVYTRPMGDS